jgi:phytoene/squalene synthetase
VEGRTDAGGQGTRGRIAGRLARRARAHLRRHPADPQGKALQPWVEEFNLPKQEFETLIDGVEMDLSFAKYPDFEALPTYCHKVASTSG